MAQEQLLAAAIRGDRSAIGELLFRETPELTRYLARQMPRAVQNELGIEDLIQQTYIAAFKGLPTLETVESIQAWLRTVAMNVLRDALRKTQRQKRGGGWNRVDAGDASASTLQLFEYLTRDSTTPSRLASANEAKSRLAIALASLPVETQRIIKFRFVDGRTFDEIGAKVGKSSGAVKGILHRALGTMNDAMGSRSEFFSTP